MTVFGSMTRQFMDSHTDEQHSAGGSVCAGWAASTICQSLASTHLRCGFRAAGGAGC